MTSVDLARMRAAYDVRFNGDHEGIEWAVCEGELEDVFSELEALRAEVDRLRAEVVRMHEELSAFRFYTRKDIEQAMQGACAVERAAIVRWLRREWESNRPADPSDYADALERGDHHESAQPPPATRPRYCVRCNNSGTIQWGDGSEMPCDVCGAKP